MRMSYALPATDPAYVATREDAQDQVSPYVLRVGHTHSGTNRGCIMLPGRPGQLPMLIRTEAA
eukprot:1941525-Rhodomonas_salina.2